MLPSSSISPSGRLEKIVSIDMASEEFYLVEQQVWNHINNIASCNILKGFLHRHAIPPAG
jgi:hypothetical protein